MSLLSCDDLKVKYIYFKCFLVVNVKFVLHILKLIFNIAYQYLYLFSNHSLHQNKKLLFKKNFFCIFFSIRFIAGY